ncbi:MAG: DJ-1 family glyoxalase III [Planctomycetota bacterium]
MAVPTHNSTPGPRAVILVAAGSEEIETIAPADVLVRAGVDVVLAAVSGMDVAGSRGLPLRADRLIGALRGELFDAIVVPGGTEGARNIAASPPAQLLIRHHAETGRLVGSICAATAVVLGPLGVLDGRRATGHPGTRAEFPAAATYADEPTVEDGQLITGRAAAASIEFGLALARRLAGPEAAERVANEMVV